MTSDSILSVKQVSTRTSLAPASLRRKYLKGEFPRPLKLSERRYGWRESDVESWLSQLEVVKDGESKP